MIRTGTKRIYFYSASPKFVYNERNLKKDGDLLVRIIELIKNMKLKNPLILFSFIIFLFLLMVQLNYINPYVATWDQVDFALGIKRYDLLAMQPHFPGYPYFILGGKLFSAFIDNPAKALSLFNILLFATIVFPIYQVGRKYLSLEKAIFMAVTIYSSSFVLLLVNQPISEGAAISIFCWYIWSLERSFYTKSKIRLIVPLLILSILFGIRLSYVPFATGIIYLFFCKWKTKGIRLKQLFIFVLLGGLFQMVWIFAIALTEGSLTGFMNLALSFTNGHFQDWGGSIGSNSSSMLERVYIFIIHNIIWTGFFAYSKALLLLFVIILFFLIYSLYKEKFSFDPFFILIVLLTFSYFTWALLAQNIDKPRHIIPLVILCLLLLFLLFLQKTNKLGIFLLSVYLVTQLTHTTSLLKEQATRLPATYQLEKFLEEKKEQFIVYTWEETRVLEYLHASFPHKRLQTYEVFQQDSGYYEDYEILLTDKVIFGFENQGINIQSQVEKIAEFHSNTLFDPVYDRITLYKWKKESGGQHE